MNKEMNKPREEKYCPNCLRKCTESEYARDGWKYGCVPCGIMLYAPQILLDTPDKRASAHYRLKQYIKPYMNYAVTDEIIDEFIKKIKEFAIELELK